MKTYYVVGYYPDTNQRFADEIEASSHKAAESEARTNRSSSLVIVASFSIEQRKRDGAYYPAFDNETHTK